MTKPGMAGDQDGDQEPGHQDGSAGGLDEHQKTETGNPNPTPRASSAQVPEPPPQKQREGDGDGLTEAGQG